MKNWSAQDWALFIGAVSAAIVAIIPIVGGFILQVLTFTRQAKRDFLAQTTHDLVNGLSQQKISAAKAESLTQGIAAGVSAAVQGVAAGVKMERDNPAPLHPKEDNK